MATIQQPFFALPHWHDPSITSPCSISKHHSMMNLSSVAGSNSSLVPPSHHLIAFPSSHGKQLGKSASFANFQSLIPKKHRRSLLLRHGDNTFSTTAHATKPSGHEHKHKTVDFLDADDMNFESVRDHLDTLLGTTHQGPSAANLPKNNVQVTLVEVDTDAVEDILLRQYTTVVATECIICDEDVEAGDGIRFSPCEHTYCKQCVHDHMRTLVFNNGVDRVTACPGLKCSGAIPQPVATAIMDDDTASKYLQFLNDQRILRSSDLTFCPRACCGSEIALTFNSKEARKDEKGREVVCGACEYSFCFDCQSDWHHDATCKESQTDTANNTALNIDWCEANGQKCPECGIYTQKLSGCEVVICGKCGHGFCWNCLEPHDHGEHTHGPNFNRSPPGTDVQVGGRHYVHRRRHRTRRKVKYGLLIAGGVIIGVILIPVAVGAIVLACGVVVISAIVYVAAIAVVRSWQGLRKGVRGLGKGVRGAARTRWLL